MSSAYKTRYEVQKIISDCLKKGIDTYLKEDGWGIMEFAQASFTSANKIILINPVRVKRLGWQGWKYKNAEFQLHRVDELIEEQHWQIHVILKKSTNPSIEDMQADDVASILVSWLNGLGVSEFRKYGVVNTRIDANQIIVYNDDSELYQKRAVFTVKIQVLKELTIEQVDAIIDGVETKPI